MVMSTPSPFVASRTFFVQPSSVESKIKSQIAEIYRLIHPYLVKELGKKYQHRRVEDFEQSTRRLLQFIDARRFAVLSQLQDAEQKPSWREHRRTGFRSYLIHY